MIERLKEVLTNPIPYIFLSPLIVALICMIYTRIRILIAKKNAEPVTVKIIELVEREGKGTKYGYDAILEITTKSEILYEKVFLNHKVEVNKELKGLYEKRPKKNFLTIDKVYNYVAPYGELIIIAFMAVILLLFMLD